MDDLLWAITIVYLGTLGLALWIVWLYVMTYRRNVMLERDNYRLIRRLGTYHSLALGDGPEPKLMPDLPPPSAVPAFFRMKRPTPPPNYKEEKN